jgi:hypothetical protein
MQKSYWGMSGEWCHKLLLINLFPNIPFRIGMKNLAVCARNAIRINFFCIKHRVTYPPYTQSVPKTLFYIMEQNLYVKLRFLFVFIFIEIIPSNLRSGLPSWTDWPVTGMKSGYWIMWQQRKRSSWCISHSFVLVLTVHFVNPISFKCAECSFCGELEAVFFWIFS